MLVSDKSAKARLDSPMNLMNKLRRESPRKSAMSLFIRPSAEKKEEILEDIKISFNPFSSQLDDKLKLVTEPLTTPEIQTPPTENLDSILKNNESQIKLGLAHDRALDLLNRSVDLLSTKLDDVKADKLPSVITATSKVVEGIRKERNEQAKNNDREVHYHFYTPQQKQVSDYEVIDVTQ